MSSLGRQTFLVVFDFDHTVVNCNTDEVIPAVLGRSKDQMRMRADGLQWTKAMDTLVAPFSREELVAAAAKSVVIDPEMPQLFRYLRKLQLEHPAITGGQADQHQRFVEVNIASDSNLLFIDASLQALLPFAIPGIHQIHSNPYNEVSAERPTDGLRARCGPNDQEEHVVNCCGVDEAERDAKYNAAWPNFQRRSRVSWYDPVGHTCGCCQAKPNMCKTHIIQRLLSTTHLIDPTIIFVGDGANDYCPILQLLRPRDYMFARRGFPAHQLISATGPEGAAGGCCHIGLWEDAKELLSLFRGAIEHPQGRLPTLARFRDVGSEEFRAQTLSRRLAAIAERTLAENRSIISNLARERVESLMNDVRSNAVVAPLPGQRAVPAWLRNFSAVEQYDGQKAGATSMEQRPAPRWGQLPWLHGEIYFFHLFWQRMMLVDGAEAAIAATSTTTGVKQDELVVNLITPNAIINPVFTQKSGLTATPGLVSPAVMTHQDFCPDLIVRKSLSIQDSVTARIHVAGGGPDEVKEVPYASLVDPVGQGLLPTHGVFANYADVFAKEKRDVLVNFLSARVLPMLQCEPWSAPVNFAPVLLRWMLWGNGLDLSIFTMEELMAKHSAGEESAGEHDKMVELARERERKSTASQDAQLVGNEADGVAQYLMQLVRQHQSGSGSQPACCHPAAAATNHLDIVMDNVGVESISDLCLGLWFIHTSRAAADTPILPTVAFHVKCMPYYVSDVTPPDFEILLTELIEASLANVAMKAAFMPFVERVREAFEQGHFTVDADTVWTQPSEYRELPPRVINRYFYTQTVAPATCTTAPANIAETLPTARDLYVANKAAFTPRSALVIFKGDLNYRRLMGDRYWNRSDFQASLATPAKSGAAVDLRNASTHYTPQQKAMMDALLCSTPAEAVMEGPTFTELVSAFWPIHVLPVCSIRTIKSECCIGVPAATKAALDDQHGLEWRTNGKLGEILFAHV